MYVLSKLDVYKGKLGSVVFKLDVYKGILWLG